MATLLDIRGNPLSGANHAAATAYMEGLGQLNLYVGDPVASAEAATADAPGFVMGHVLRAWLYLLSTEAPAQTPARESWLLARNLSMTDQEAGHITAIRHLLDGRWHQAARVLEDVTIAHPLDLLALQVGHQLDFFTGQARMLRDRIARATRMVPSDSWVARGSGDAGLWVGGNGRLRRRRSRRTGSPHA